MLNVLGLFSNTGASCIELFVQSHPLTLQNKWLHKTCLLDEISSAGFVPLVVCTVLAGLSQDCVRGHVQRVEAFGCQYPAWNLSLFATWHFSNIYYYHEKDLTWRDVSGQEDLTVSNNDNSFIPLQTVAFKQLRKAVCQNGQRTSDLLRSPKCAEVQAFFLQNTGCERS